jgi:hypothetical protein
MARLDYEEDFEEVLQLDTTIQKLEVEGTALHYPSSYNIIRYKHHQREMSEVPKPVVQNLPRLSNDVH